MRISTTKGLLLAEMLPVLKVLPSDIQQTFSISFLLHLLLGLEKAPNGIQRSVIQQI